MKIKIAKMRYTAAVLLFAEILILLSFASCTADNEKKPLICRRIGFDADENGNILITAIYNSVGEFTKSEKGEIVKTLRAKNAEGAVKELLSQGEHAMYKPAEQLVFGKNLGEKLKKELVIEILNHSEFQLKCKVFESDSAHQTVQNENALSKDNGTDFQEYFRKITEAAKDKQN